VFRDLVGLLLLELRRDMGLGPALVGALLRFLLSLFLARGVQLRRVLFSLLDLLIGFVFLLGLAFLGALLIFSLAVGFTFRRLGLSFGVALGRIEIFLRLLPSSADRRGQKRPAPWLSVWFPPPWSGLAVPAIRSGCPQSPFCLFHLS
jgi:hypothetical protein